MNLLLLSCLVSLHAGYHSTAASLPKDSIHLSEDVYFVDLRDSVLSGARKPSWIGWQRPFFRIGQERDTLNVRPSLATDWVGMLNSRLNPSQGFEFGIGEGNDLDSIVRQIAQKKRGRFSMIEIKNFRIDCDLECSTQDRFINDHYDSNGMLIGKDTSSLATTVKGNSMDTIHSFVRARLNGIIASSECKNWNDSVCRKEITSMSERKLANMTKSVQQVKRETENANTMLSVSMFVIGVCTLASVLLIAVGAGK